MKIKEVKEIAIMIYEVLKGTNIDNIYDLYDIEDSLCDTINLTSDNVLVQEFGEGDIFYFFKLVIDRTNKEIKDITVKDITDVLRIMSKQI